MGDVQPSRFRRMIMLEDLISHVPKNFNEVLDFRTGEYTGAIAKPIVTALLVPTAEGTTAEAPTAAAPTVSVREPPP